MSPVRTPERRPTRAAPTRSAGLTAALHIAEDPRVADATRRGPVRRSARRLRAHRVSLALAGALILATSVVQLVGLSGWPARYDDEGTYVAQAWAVTHLHALGHYTYWYDHPPLGWLLLAVLQWPVDAIGGAPNAIAAGRVALVPVTAISSALVYLLARRLGMRRGFAALALGLFALCPLALNYHRMVWLDNLAVPWLLGAFYLALTPGRRLWATAGSGACFAAAILTKETMVLLLPALLLAAWNGTERSTRRYALTAFGASLVLVCVFYPLLAVVKSELLPGTGHVSLAYGLDFQLFGRRSSGSVFDAGSLSAKYVRDWIYLDRWLLAASLVLAAPALLNRRLQAIAVTLLIQEVALLRPGYLPVPYVIVVLPFAALVVAGTLDAAWRWRPRPATRLPRRAGPAAVTAFLAVAAVAVAPGWARMDRKEMTFDADVPLKQAQAWVYGHVDPDSRVLVDDTFWVDLVERGFKRERVVWYYKLGTDSRVDRRYPEGWRGFDYVISSDAMRSGPTPQASQAILHSRVVARFGSESRRLEVRRIVR